MVFTALGYAGSFLTGWPLGLILGFLFATALSALKVKVSKNRIIHTLLVLTVTVAFCMSGAQGWVDMGFLPWAVGVGSAAHLVGDMLTKEGCPLLCR